MFSMLIAMLLPVLGIFLFYLFPFKEAFPIYAALTAFSVLIYYGMFSVMGMKRKVRTGPEGMIDKEAMAVEDIDPNGIVRFHGEIWSARTKGTNVCKGDKVKIRAIKGMILYVEKENRK
jgi:membrane protein implicated in regulation of membrane protease activity